MRSERHGKSEIFLTRNCFAVSVSISRTVLPIPRIFRQKGGSTGYDGYKKVNGNKLSVLVDRNGPPLACTVVPANIHDSRIYEPTLEAFEIPDVQDRPAIVSADAAYDAQEIRQYNRKRRIKSNIPVNLRSRIYPKRGRSFWFDPELYKKRSAIERFFS
jgi:transposase